MPVMFNEHTPLAWIVFNLGILGILAFDLFLFHRQPREIPVREALRATAVYVALALCFNAWIYWQSGEAKAIQFLTGYFIEYALSMDNILVFVVILAYFQVPAELQMRVLLWGILGSRCFARHLHPGWPGFDRSLRLDDNRPGLLPDIHRHQDNKDRG